MFLSVIILVVSLAAILVGASVLTDGAAAVASRWGVSDLVIGLTVVAFGTSAPELVISVVSAIEGSSEIAIGNVVGSNILNIFIIIGLTAVISPVKVTKNVLTVDIPFVILSSVVLLAMGNSCLLDGTSVEMLTRVDGIILLLFFIIFLIHTFSTARADKDAVSHTEVESAKPLSGFRSAIYIIGGLGALVAGGDFFVRSASDIASGLGVSEAVVGLTIVAFGTSLPELATSVTAALKGRDGMAVGNVIGSVVFNVFMVLGVSATVRPLEFGTIGNFDLLTLLLASVLFYLFGWLYRRRTITRVEGALLVGCYVAYMVVLILQTKN